MELALTELAIPDMKIYGDYMRQCNYPANIWISNFPYLWALNRSPRIKILWTIVDELFVTFIETSNKNRHLRSIPYGKADATKVVEVTVRCLNYCKQWNKMHTKEPQNPYVKLINEAQLDFLMQSPLLQKHLKTKVVTGTEYHYNIPNLLTLKGKEFQYIRRKRNKFTRNYPEAIIREYNANDYQKVLRVNKRWNQRARKRHKNIIDRDYFKTIVTDHKRLQQIVLVCELKNEIIGMISGGPSLNGQSWCSLRKTLSDEYEGLSEVLLLSLVERIATINSQVTLLNDGSNLGSPGLQYFKEKFRPAHKYKRFRLYLK